MVLALAPAQWFKIQQTLPECLIYARRGNEHNRHGPCLRGAIRLEGQAGKEQKIPTVVSAPK